MKAAESRIPNAQYRWTGH